MRIEVDWQLREAIDTYKRLSVAGHAPQAQYISEFDAMRTIAQLVIAEVFREDTRETMPVAYDRTALVEVLAAIEHQRWADWQIYVHNLGTQNADGTITLPAASVKHWDRQIHTAYADLTEREKDSDREQVERYLETIYRHVVEYARKGETA